MKKYIGITISFIFILLLGLSNADAWSPNGTWVNIDTSEADIQRLVINYPFIHGFGQCTPSPCDWGNALYASGLVATHDYADADKDTFFAVWIFSFKWMFMQISPHPENPDYIIVTTQHLYDLAGDSRTNRFNIEYLKKQ